MKKFLLLFISIVWVTFLNAAPFKFLPYTITQPNGEVIECFVSGDEYFNWIHDKDGYTIIQNEDGYYYYAVQKGSKISPSSYKVNKANPETLGIKKWITISTEEYSKKKSRFKVPTSLKAQGSQNAPHTGTLNNIVIYISFANDAEIANTRQYYDEMMNSTTEYSIKTYFTEVSYNNLNVNSTHYPACATPATTNVSYKDSHNRNYFRPYNASTNTIGYTSDNEATQREHQLLFDAVTWINANSPVDASINIDGDSDGKVDNVCFIIKGNSDGWSDLLWAHRWMLYTKNISINGKRVYDYTFQPESQCAGYVLCHEMFHALGAPDLYHYETDFRTLTPVGSWDLMESGQAHMGAYMKWKYAGAKWITSIPTITSTGTYTLNPLSSPTNNCYKIPSPSSDKEFFVVEYRKKEGQFESYVPGSGLVVYRINTDFEGNASFDNSSVFDEVYIYRPNGSTFENGSTSSAFFSSNSGRTAINDATNPSSFLHDGLPGVLDISGITSADATISFNVYISSVAAPTSFTANGISESQINLNWTLNSNNNDVLVASSTSGKIGSPAKGSTYSVGATIPGGGTVIYAGNSTSFNHTSLIAGTSYLYKIWSKNSSNEYSARVSAIGQTTCAVPTLPFSQGFNGVDISPCWAVTTVAVGATEDEPASITQVQSSTTPNASPYEGTHMIRFNSTYCGAGNKMRLESPAFSTVGQSQVKVSFAWHRDTQWPDLLDNMKIQWSADGINWNDGPTYQRYHTVISWTLQSFNLPAEALNKTDIRIGFLFNSEYGYNCYLDDVKITNTVTGVSIDELDELTVYPNPSNGNFTLKLNNNYSTMSVKAFDFIGRLVYANNYEGTIENTVDLSGLAKGVYMLKIQVDGQVTNRKIVVE